MFRRFSQATNYTNKAFGGASRWSALGEKSVVDLGWVAGSGLGLWISKRITEQMGGRIEVDSEFGKGCSKSFSVPSYGHHGLTPLTATQHSVSSSVPRRASGLYSSRNQRRNNTLTAPSRPNSRQRPKTCRGPPKLVVESLLSKVRKPAWPTSSLTSHVDPFS